MSPLNRRRLLQLTGGLALAASTPALSKQASAADLSGDVALMREAFTAIHPAIYSYNSPAEMSARFDLLASEWASSGSFEDRLLTLTRLTAAFRCGHTYPNPWNQSQSVQARMFEGRRGVPFEFLWLDGTMVVTRDRSSAGLFSRGDAVVAVNGVTTSELLRRLMPLSRADGSADAKRVNNMEMRGDNRFEAFDIHLPLVLRGLAEEADFTLHDGRTVRAGLLTLAERQSTMAAATNDDSVNPWTLITGDDGIVRLTCPTWALYDATWDWRSWLGTTMDDLAADGARGLIVDLRGNEGGLSECGDIIASRLISADIESPRSLRFVRYRRVDPALNPYLSTWDNGFRDWGERAVGPDDRGLYRLTDEDDDTSGMVRPAGRQFRRPVMVLCDASNSSATFGFAQMVKDNGLATLVGPATGGTRRGVNGGYFFMRLPASGFEVDLPHTAIVPRTPQPDEPVLPDVVVGFSRADIAAGYDPQMAAATARILNA